MLDRENTRSFNINVRAIRLQINFYVYKIIEIKSKYKLPLSLVTNVNKFEQIDFSISQKNHCPKG